MGEEKEKWCPAAREKAGKKRENPGQAGHGRRKREVMPRRQRKNREEERKSGSGGAWKKKKRSGAPPSEKKQGRREKIRVRRGMGEEKEK